MNYLVTGSAGFIGYHTASRLLKRGDTVIGLDNLSDYYDPELKRARLKLLSGEPGFTFQELDIADQKELGGLFERQSPERVIHLAAQAGVRYSITNPGSYIQSNLVGFANILEACRNNGTQHLTYASSSSVYGMNTKMPFSVHDNVDHPVSLYAATKKANELMAHSYSNLFNLPTTGLRFFTVYGPWGRPDMALFLFTQAILKGEPIKVFNNGDMLRDFTYVDDVAEGVIRASDRIAQPDPEWNSIAPDPSTSCAPYKVYNIGNNMPVSLLKMIEVVEDCLGKKAVKTMLPMQPGDVRSTYANIDELVRDTGYKPSTSIEDGVRKFVDWYREFYAV